MGFDTALADRITAVVLFLLGIAMLYGGYTMDRLEIRAIHPASIPGLVPMILGAVLALCAALLFVKASPARQQTAPQAEPQPNQTVTPAEPPAQSAKNLLITAGWSIFYALFLVGWLPFLAATAIYITGFIAIFGSLREAAPVARLKSGVFAIVFALLASAAIATLFRDAFLVRLP